MDFRQFRYFVTVADDLHFARAAERLGMSQPALSQQIKALEKQLGAELFVRAKRRIALTEAGAAFLGEARSVLEKAERAVRLARDTARGEAGRVDIGIVGSAMYEERFPQVLKIYRERRPAVRLTLHERPILDQIEAVRRLELDVAIIREPLPQPLPEGLESFCLSTQRLLVLLPEGHTLTKARSIALSALAGDDFLAFLDPEGVGLGHALHVLCRSAGFEPRIRQEVREVGTLVSLVAAGFGVSLMPETVRHLRLPGVRYVPLRGKNIQSRLLAVHRRFERSAAVHELVTDMRRSARAA